ncbi:hypothetical protein RclHR1_02910023 [Rhizophagus clarus]|uniref:Uncharacterized protein n=1 Tax=Rhizophagus clarus TaxID=94130 RepID=A0A2Z6R4V3_9GLOM|nr:hypothetical protein RclHR1_02910023 [Rhizophagus clarus]GES89021.1 hypothetical protein RCL_jg16975.t1 [Rhizophagus clarus]
MDSTLQKIIFEDTELFFRCYKDDIFKLIKESVTGIIMDDPTLFAVIDIVEEALKGYVSCNKDVIQLLEVPKKFIRGSIQPIPFKFPLLPTFLEIILGRFVKRSGYHDHDTCAAEKAKLAVQQQQTQPVLNKKIFQDLQHQLESMILDDSQGDAKVKVPSIPYHPTPITPPVTPLFRSQKKSARKKLKKLQ